MKTTLLTLAGCALAFAATASDITFHGNGEAVFDTFRLRPVIHGEGWRKNAEGRSFAFPDASGSVSYDVKTTRWDGGETFAKARATCVATADGRAFYTAHLVSARDQKPELVALELLMGCEAVGGGAWETSSGKKGTFAKTFVREKGIDVFTDACRWVKITPKGGKTWTLSFPAPLYVHLQDNRIWGPTFELRIAPLAGVERGAFPKGSVSAFACFVAASDGVKVRPAAPFVVKQGPDWLPIDYIKDVEAGSALDFSNQGLQDAPAGKYGWMRNVGGHFEFEGRPGKKVRLYGVNLCFDANFPERDEADRIVTRLVRLGYNTIRVHHYESPNGVVKGSPDHLAINAERTKKLDYLLSRAMAAGLYVTTDLYTCRKVRWDEIGLKRPAWATEDHVDNQLYKNLIAVHEPAFQNWRRFATNFLTHVNPYTGRRYADEPGLPLISLINEGHLSWCWERIIRLEPMKRAWREWLAKRRAADPAYAKGVSDDCEKMGDTSTAVFGDFMADLEIALVARERAAMREIGVKALLTSQNCGWHSVSLEKMREVSYDYVDDHFYVDHPEFLDRAWTLPSFCNNRNPALAGGIPPESIAFTRLADKPFTVTEWNFSGPGMYRGVGGIMTGAMGALQDWDGLWRFAYSHGLEGMRTGQGIPTYFDVASDPLGQASDRASICLFLRGDLEPLADNVAISHAADRLNAGGKWRSAVAKWRDETWRLRVATSVGGETAGWNVRPADDKAEPPVKPRDNPAIVRDMTRGSFAINTPRTAGGFTPSGRLAAGAVTIDVGNVAATVWASSLDGKPIPASRRLLVTHLTDVQADGNVYLDETKRTILNWGKFPPIARRGSARVEIALDAPQGYSVWALATSGRRIERIASAVENGRLVFTANVAGPKGARLLYEVVK